MRWRAPRTHGAFSAVVGLAFAALALSVNSDRLRGLAAEGAASSWAAADLSSSQPQPGST